MIARIWRGAATPDNADAYFRHVTTRVFPALPRIDGHRGAYLLRRQSGDRVEFLAVTLWQSIEAIHGFAGADAETAIVEPEGRAALAEFDPFAQHFEIVAATDCEPR